jgi:BirA family biotin operon repressor/biotin-[acetyl-CoA-carboxylase] ligase
MTGQIRLLRAHGAPGADAPARLELEHLVDQQKGLSMMRKPPRRPLSYSPVLGAAPVRLELARCESTQAELARLAEAGAPPWSWVRADEQTAGRGRRGRHWSAPAGTALLASILLRPARAPAELAALSLVAGAAVCETARSVGADASLVWPNDVVTAGGKLAGTLPELVPGPAILLGVGVNVDDAPALEPPRRAVSLRALGLDPPSPRELLERLVERLQPLAEAFDAGGFVAVASRVRELDALAGRTVAVELAAGARIEGTGAGIADDGALLVETAGGTHMLTSGEVVRVTP